MRYTIEGFSQEYAMTLRKKVIKRNKEIRKFKHILFCRYDLNSENLITNDRYYKKKFIL